MRILLTFFFYLKSFFLQWRSEVCHDRISISGLPFLKQNWFDKQFNLSKFLSVQNVKHHFFHFLLLKFKLMFLPSSRFTFFTKQLIQKRFTFRAELNWEALRSESSVKISTVRKFLKKYFFDSSRQSNWNFVATASFFSSISVLIENFSPMKENLGSKLYTSFLTSNPW